jgi:hypothetical protein
MNDLLFTALTLATLYYFFYYLPEQKQLSTKNQPFSESKAVQTETLPNPDEKLLESTLDELIKEMRKLNQTIK